LPSLAVLPMSNQPNPHYICVLNIRAIPVPNCHSQVVCIHKDPTDFIGRINEKASQFPEFIAHEWFVRPVRVYRYDSENTLLADLDSGYNYPLAYTDEFGVVVFNKKHPLHAQYILPQTK